MIRVDVRRDAQISLAVQDEPAVDMSVASFAAPGGSGEGGFLIDKTLKFVNGVLSVNTASRVEANNTLPVTSAAVHVTVGNIEALLHTI